MIEKQVGSWKADCVSRLAVTVSYVLTLVHCIQERVWYGGRWISTEGSLQAWWVGVDYLWQSGSIPVIGADGHFGAFSWLGFWFWSYGGINTLRWWLYKGFTSHQVCIFFFCRRRQSCFLSLLLVEDILCPVVSYLDFDWNAFTQSFPCVLL